MSTLCTVLGHPERIRALSPAGWDLLLREARSQQLCARLSHLLEQRGLLPECPPQAATELCAQRFFAEHTQARVRLCLRKLRRALAPTETPVVLLKGAAYAARGLAVARGRDFADLDILLPVDKLEAAETRLCASGWTARKTDPYDQRYYRRWMHELPPLVHTATGLELDVHHRLLPRTSRLKPPAAPLWRESVPLALSPYRTLSPRHMVLHSMAQLFHDGEVAGGLDNLLDIHQLLTELGIEEGFWPGLLEAAEGLHLERPLYYGLEMSRSLLGTAVPSDTLAEARRFRPPALTGSLMCALMRNALEPRYPRRRPAHVSAWLLYLRSHWLRMPPALLASHLTRKAVATLLAPASVQDTRGP